MATASINIVANTGGSPALLADLRKPRGADFYESMILAYGTFGGGTLAFFLSPNNGTTLIPLTTNMGGTGISCTSDAMAVITLGTPSKLTPSLRLYCTLTGATNPNIIVNNYDNAS